MQPRLFIAFAIFPGSYLPLSMILFGNTFTNDLLYDKPEGMLPALQKMHILAVEMETSALYTIAAQYRAHALSLLTACVNSITGEEPNAEQLQKTLNNMFELALETAIFSD